MIFSYSVLFSVKFVNKMDWEEDNVYNSICRTCLKYTTYRMVPLVDENGLTCYGQSVITFANIEMSNRDEFPSKMCQNCLRELKQVIKFKFKCEENHKQLQKLSTEYEFKDKIVECSLFAHHFPDMLNFEDQKPVTQNTLTDDEFIGNYASFCNDNVKSNVNFGNKEINNFNDDAHEYIFTSETNDSNSNLQKVTKTNSVSNDANDILLEEIEKMIEASTDSDDVIPLKMPVVRRKRIIESKVIIKSDGTKVRKMFVRYQKKGESTSKNRDGKFVCKICHKTLTGQGSYRQHMERHSDCKYICELCAKGFRCRTDLNVHQAIHHDIGNNYHCDHCSFKCLRCPRRFHNRGDMMAHMNNVHERRHVYECPQCAVTYAKSCTVRRHLVDVHGVQRERQGPVKRVSRSIPTCRRLERVTVTQLSGNETASSILPPSEGPEHALGT